MEFPAAVAQKKVPLLYGPVLLGSYSLSRTEVPEKDRLVVQELPGVLGTLPKDSPLSG